MKRKRAGALYIRNQELLLISEGGKGMYWTPGGGLEEGESFEQALQRELDEELGATLKSSKQFYKLYDEVADEEIVYFLVDMDLPATLINPDTKIHWYSAQDFERNVLAISPRIFNQVYPELLAQKLV